MKSIEIINNFLDFFSPRLDFIKNLFPEDFGIYIEFFPIFFVGLILAFLITPILGYISQRFKILDKPSKERVTKLNKYDVPERHMHEKPTPLLGGLAFLIPIIITLIMFIGIAPEIKAILIAVLILVLVGILDDIFNLPAIHQFIGQLIAALVICFSPLSMNYINVPLDGTITLNWLETSFTFFDTTMLLSFPGDLVMLIWILICINAIKFVNGSDGLMEGNAIIISLLFFVLAVRTEADMIIILSLMLAGGLTGFLFYNFPPAKIFSGSAGKTTLGFLIAVIAILNDTKFAASIMILTLPMIDFFFVVIKRYLTYKPKGFFELIRINDTNHLHHQLILLGLTPKKVLLVETSITLIVGLIAISTTGAMNLFLFILVVLLIIIAIFVLHTIVNKRNKAVTEPPKDSDTKSPESRYSY